MLHGIHLSGYMLEANVKTGRITNSFVFYLTKIHIFAVDLHRVQPIIIEDHVDGVEKGLFIVRIDHVSHVVACFL